MRILFVVRLGTGVLCVLGRERKGKGRVGVEGEVGGRRGVGEE